MCFNSRVSILGAKNAKRETTMETIFILAKVINKEVAKTKASFLTFSQDT